MFKIEGSFFKDNLNTSFRDLCDPISYEFSLKELIQYQN